MGSLKDQMIDDQNERAYQKRLEKLANYYGFDVSDVDGLDVEIEPNIGNDDFHYGWYVRFPEETPQHIKDAVGDNGFATLDINFFDEYAENDLSEEERPSFGDMNSNFAKGLADEMRKRNNPGADKNGGQG